jgi:hypothetical protein
MGHEQYRPVASGSGDRCTQQMLVDTEALDEERCSLLSRESRETFDQRLTLWKFDTAIWLVLQVID